METLKPSTGETLFDLTLYVADTHANHSAKQATDKAQTTRDTCGLGLETPLANYDPDTQSWKMYGDTYLWGDSPLLDNLPVSGITRNGDLYQQQAWELRTCESELSLWPTPTAVTRPMEGNVRMYRAIIEAGKMTEAEANAILGKPVTDPQGKLQRWPTPVASNAWTDGLKSSQQKDGLRHSLNLPSAVGGKLNPTWVEWLMGFPIGWTDLEDLETL
jgi:hypothetical protein